MHLSKGVRGLLVELCQQSRALLAAEDPSSDPAVARLFPPAYEDDPLRNLEFETNLGGAPRTGKLEAIDTVERTAHATALTEDELLAWVGVVNDLRLVARHADRHHGRGDGGGLPVGRSSPRHVPGLPVPRLPAAGDAGGGGRTRRGGAPGGIRRLSRREGLTAGGAAASTTKDAGAATRPRGAGGRALVPGFSLSLYVGTSTLVGRPGISFGERSAIATHATLGGNVAQRPYCRFLL